MLKFKADTRGLQEISRQLNALPGQIKRAQMSALKSTSWTIQQELRNHVEYGGSGWKSLHPMTMRFYKKRGSQMSSGVGWQKRDRNRHGITALFWLGKFARYRVNQEGTFADIDFGRSRRGRPGTFDPLLVGVVRRHERGERIPVTDKMRKALATTRPTGRGRRNAVPGRDYFPLRKTTTFLQIPARAIFGPVWRKVQPRLRSHFEQKFRAAIERYQMAGRAADVRARYEAKYK